MERLQRLTYPVVLVYLWVMMILLGAIMLETFMIYPNIFRNAPESLAYASGFFSEASPATFFRPLGMLSWALGIAAVGLSWPVGSVRRWVALSLLCIVADGAASMLFFWPRNTIMFVEGSAMHSPEVLRQTAEQFEQLHWLRVAFNAASAVFAFIGFVALDRWRVAQGAHSASAVPAETQRLSAA
ncbi:MAG: hypothetical protein M3Z20_03125 [Chloroflexota bacterium]|nr:hypothetical protein [Chloroflexota bacterium]